MIYNSLSVDNEIINFTFILLKLDLPPWSILIFTTFFWHLYVADANVKKNKKKFIPDPRELLGHPV